MVVARQIVPDHRGPLGEAVHRSHQFRRFHEQASNITERLGYLVGDGPGHGIVESGNTGLELAQPDQGETVVG